MGNRTCRFLPGGCDCLHEQDSAKCSVVKGDSKECDGMIGTIGARTEFAVGRGIRLRDRKPDGPGHLSDGAFIARSPASKRSIRI